MNNYLDINRKNTYIYNAYIHSESFFIIRHNPIYINRVDNRSPSGDAL